MFGVGALSQAQNAPTSIAVGVLQHLLRYLSGSIYHGITFRRGSNTDFDLLGYSDASWASVTNARSTSGILFSINGAPILWQSKLQTIVARSTCEAEYVACDLAAREATWLQLFWHEICRRPLTLEPRTIPLKIDSQSALALALKKGYQARNRHFLIRAEAVRQAQERQIINLTYTPSASMAADGFTKVLKPGAQARSTFTATDIAELSRQN